MIFCKAEFLMEESTPIILATRLAWAIGKKDSRRRDRDKGYWKAIISFSLLS